MKPTRTDRSGNLLVSAQVAINRAVFELNIRQESNPPGRGRAPDDEYTLHCVIDAVRQLSQAAEILLGKSGARK